MRKLITMPIYRHFYRPDWPRPNYISQVNDIEGVFIDLLYWEPERPKRATVAIWKIRYK